MFDHRNPLSIKECEKAFGQKAIKWMGRCHEVACALNDRLDLQLFERYGMYSGPVVKGFYLPGRPAYQHGWLETSDGRVVDFTRWVFEARKPYVFVSSRPCGCMMYDPDKEFDGLACCLCGHAIEEHSTSFFQECQVGPVEYDVGAERFNSAHERPVPAENDSLARYDFTLKDPKAAEYVGRLFRKYPNLHLGQLHYLGNLGPTELGSLAAPIYEKLIEIGKSAMIPYDFRVAVLNGGRYGPLPKDCKSSRRSVRLPVIADLLEDRAT